jgi:spermidine/putrescine-binding protein
MKLKRILPLLVIAAVFATFARAADKELNLYAWSEYIPESVIENFTKETGIKVNYETFSSGEEMLAKLLAGGTRYDLIQPPDYIAEALIKNKMLVALDYKKLPNFKNLLPEFTKMPHDPEQKFTIPYMAGTVGIVVNTDKIKEPITSYADMFSGKYKDRIVVLDDGRELVVAALYTLGIGLNDITEANLAKARPVLAAWFKQVKLFDSDSPKTALLNGDVDLGLVWGGEAAILWSEDKKFQYILPAEGAHLFVDVLTIPKRARNVDAAHKFLDYILRPEVSAELSGEFPYTNPNGEARKLLTPEQLGNPGSYPKINKPLDTFRHIGESGALIDELITDLKNAQ